MTATATATAPITMEVHICADRRSYMVEFATEAQALEFIKRKWSTHSICEVYEHPIDRAHLELLTLLYPQCEHGLSLDLCFGPGHYSDRI